MPYYDYALDLILDVESSHGKLVFVSSFSFFSCVPVCIENMQFYILDLYIVFLGFVALTLWLI